MENGTFWEHVEELRQTLIKILLAVAVGSVCSLFFYEQVMHVLTLPLESERRHLMILAPTDGLAMVMKTCFLVGAVISSPVWLYYCLQFIAPALRSQERKLIAPFFLLSFIFLLLGLLFAFFAAIPFANQYLDAFNTRLGENCWTLPHYIDYTLLLLLANALAFELCVMMLFFVHYGIFSSRLLIARRKGVIIGIFILAAILTPPDVFTQLMLAIPLIAFYEAAILYSSLKTRVVKSRSRLPSRSSQK
ncbi:MAG: twin-arginine translocase subunit TatC [Waddliaceae bacterium]